MFSIPATYWKWRPPLTISWKHKKHKKWFYGQLKINVVSNLNFNIDLTLLNLRYLDVEIRLPFQF